MLGVTVLGSGSKGNCLIVHGADGDLLVDAGFSLRETRRRMDEAGLDMARLRAIVISHEHSDHVKGLKAIAGKLQIPVYCNRGTGEVIKERGLKPAALSLFAAGSPFRVGDLLVEPFSIPHDAMDPMGFVVHGQQHKLGIVTDLGHASQMVKHHLRQCDAVILESNHDVTLLQQSRRPWALKQRIVGRHGHLSNDDSMALLADIVDRRTRHVILAHASQDCNRYDLVADCVAAHLRGLNRGDIQAHVATQEAILPTLWTDRRGPT